LLRRRVFLLVTLVFILLAGFVIENLETWLGGTALRLDRPQNHLVQRGDTLTTLATRFSDNGLLSNPQQLLLLARLQGGGNRILAGEYEFIPGQTVAQLLAALTSGNTIKEQLTIIEGDTFAQLIERIHSAAGIVVTTADLDPGEIMREMGLPGEVAEGNFFPDTYFYSAGITDLTLLNRIHETMQSHLDSAWQDRAEGLAIDSPEAALILASIIEKESGTESERRRISGVFHRRMERGMRLQADSTIIYGLGTEFDGDLRRRDMRRDTPYNSYLHGGLPPTAIALPGLASIRAAVNPDRSDETLYFVATGKGGHKFSTTLAEHNRAVRRYQLGIK